MSPEEVIESIREGNVGVIPTDTLYGLVGSALLPDAVERVYVLKHRNPDKPLIVLVSEIAELEQFGVVLSDELIKELESYWPGPYSIVLRTIDEDFHYLTRGTETIAFRLPDDERLIEILRQTGPLVAPSANIEGQPPARTVSEAKKYFGTDSTFYLDGGVKDGPPSTVIALDEFGLTVIRDGKEAEG